MKRFTVICCIFVFFEDCLGANVNLALGKPAIQSSTGWNGTASRAVDGNKNGDFFAHSCTHTSLLTPHWWQVDLQEPSVIYQVKIKNRNRFGHRLADFNVYAGMTMDDLEICAYFKGPGADNTEYAMNCARPIIGRFVKIQKKIEDEEYLCLCEVEVMGRLVNLTNLALGQTATQSTTLNNGVASLAVDGNKNPNYDAGSCTRTNDTAPPHWWKVDLGQQSVVYQVKIKNRDMHGFRLEDLDIDVGVSTCAFKQCAYFSGPGIDSQEHVFNCTFPLIGHYVRIQKYYDTNLPLTLCEVEVIGMHTSDV